MANTTTTTTKVTKRMRFEALLAMESVKSDPEMVEFLEHQIELLSKKNGSSSSTKLQKENADLKDSILEAMEPNVLYTITDMIKTFDFLAEMTNQKVSALVRQLVNENLVERIEDKKKTYFKLI